MLTAAKKIVKTRRTPSELETQVAQALFDLEANAAADLKADLKHLQIVNAKEIDVDGGKKAVLITVPYVLLKPLHKAQVRLERELEKKFSGKTVMFLAQRRIMPRQSKKTPNKVYRPRNRTLTAVHEALIHDLVYPTDVVGERLRVRPDGSKLKIVLLDPKEKENAEPKLKAFCAAYKQLTGKVASFEFPIDA